MDRTAYIASALFKRRRVIVCLVSMAAGVGLPFLVHLFTRAAGITTPLGEVLLPMHFPLMVASMASDPFCAALISIIAPFANSLILGMPAREMLVYIMIELVVLNVSLCIIARKLPIMPSIMVAVILSRVAKLLAVAIAVKYLNATGISVAIVLASIKRGAVGVVLQILFAPIPIYYMLGLLKRSK